MKTGTHRYKSDFARRYYGRGQVEEAVQDILEVLDARGIAVPDHTRERVAGCDDLNQLKAWLRRAATVTTVEDLFA